MERRTFLAGAAASALAAATRPFLWLAAAAEDPFARFTPVAPTDRDELVLPGGFRHDIVLKWGDPFTGAGETFGYNNDWIGVFPLQGADDVLMVVNHEYVSLARDGDAPLYPDSFAALRGRPARLEDYRRDMGLSVVRVRQKDGRWTPVKGDRLNRRVDGFTRFATTGPASALLGPLVEGTFENCAGQATPWGTALSCEENIQNWVPVEVDAAGTGVRGGIFDLRGTDYGWVVEVDPFDPGATPVKHTALGRFRHENVGLRAVAGRPLAGYMGDDRVRGHVWKFVSDEAYKPGDAPRNRRLLRAGRLYVARFEPDGRGEWRLLDLSAPLDPNPSEKDLKPAFPAGARRLGDCYASQGAVLMDAYRAANAIGGTPSGRPEDLEVHPQDGSVYVAFTAPAPPSLWENPFGEVWRIQEEGGEVESLRFRWTRFAVGGPAAQGSGFTQPDNIAFDAHGDLWLTGDITAEKVNADPRFAPFGNSGFFRFNLSGEDRGRARQFASLPCEAEPSGPAFSPDAQTLFLSVQHPGERHGIRRAKEDAPRGSNWPGGRPGQPPLPAVVAIRRA